MGIYTKITHHALKKSMSSKCSSCYMEEEDQQLIFNTLSTMMIISEQNFPKVGLQIGLVDWIVVGFLQSSAPAYLKCAS